MPWYADVGSCGGTLIQPDRVMTAEHCVRDRALDQLGVGVAGQSRAVRGITFAPGWQHRNGANNVYDDIAIVTLDRRRGRHAGDARRRPDRAATILGKGRTSPSSSGSDLRLRRADLRTLSDKECKATWGEARGNDGERFVGSKMLCAIDLDGR